MSDKHIDEEELYSKPADDDDLYSDKVSLDKEPIKIEAAPRPKTFHSKNFMDNDAEDEEDKRTPQKSQLKMKLSHAETSGVAISAVMLVYSLSEEDKPLFFLSTALLIFLLRPLIGVLFGKYNRAVQNALHSFSIVLFIGALIMLFL